MNHDLLVVAIYAVTAAPFIACVARYWPLPWRTEPIGRALMALFLSISAVLLLAIALRFIGSHGWLPWLLRLLTLGSVTVSGWRVFVQIVRLARQRNGVH